MILISPTAFKGTLSPRAAALIMSRVVKKIKPQEKQIRLPLADGGDGTLEVLLSSLRGVKRRARVTGPLGIKTTAQWGFIKKNKTAVIEMAEASGLKLVTGKNKILKATSFGTGELIRQALNAGCRRILIGVGGTATADGGAGALQALGLKYFDQQGRRLSGSPSDLIKLNRIDWRGLDKRLSGVSIVVLCDVKNPLLGKNGSAHVFGPQKGATPAQVLFLEKVLRHWSSFAQNQTKNKPGAGAAGAVAFGLSAFLGARLVDGCSAIMDAVRWMEKAKEASLILTGEGRLDQTSFGGKVIGAICRKRKGTKVMAVCGATNLSPNYLKKKGIAAIQVMGKQGLVKPGTALKKSTEQLLRGE